MSGENQSRAVVFGRDAVAYDEVRPSYPAEVIDHVQSLVAARDALEVGAGTGKATAAMAGEGLNITCLEPSTEMAAILEAKQLPGVTVAVISFEDWDGPASSQDLVYAAQAWHWVDPATGFDKTLDLLRPGGALALFWNVPLDRYAHHETAYAQHAPHLLEERDERIKRRDTLDWTQDMSAAGFVDTGRFTYRWSQQLSSDQYRTLYSTYSDHIMLDEPERTRLLDALAADVESWGGTTTIEYRSEVFSGRKPGTDRG